MRSILCIFVFIFSLLSGQEKSYPKIDSALQFAIKNFQRDGDSKKTIAINFELVKKSRQLNYTKGIGWGYLNIGNLLTTVNQYEESLKYLELAEKEINKTEDFPLKAKLYTDIGKVNHFLGLYEIALDYYNKAIKECEKITDLKKKRKILHYSYACKADNFEFLNQNDSMYIYFHKAYHLNPDPITTSNIANYFIVHQKQEIDSAKYYLEIASTKLHEKTYPLFQKLAVFRTHGDFFYTKREYKKALDYYLQSLEIADKMKKRDEKRSLFKVISTTYKALNNEKKYTEYLQNYTLLNDSLNIEDRKALNLSINKALKDKEFETQNERDKLNHKSNYIIISVIVVSITLILLIYLELNKKNLRKRIIIEEQEFRLFNKRSIIKEKEVEIEKLQQKVSGTFEEILHLAKQNDPTFLARFQEIYPDFCQNILELQPDILNSEFHFIAYLKLNFSTKEIANYTFVTEKAVQARKSRIRKKFNIPSDEDLYIWFNKI